MRTYNLVIDTDRNASYVQGKTGRRYTLAELRAAEDGFGRGDPAAQAVIHDVDLGLDAGGRPCAGDPGALLAQALADCPECQAALARGERPQPFHEAALLALLPRAERRRIARARERAARKAERAALRAAGRGHGHAGGAVVG